MHPTSRSLTVRFSLIQAGYWGVFCTLYAFASVYLLARGFTNGQIGLLLALCNTAAVVLQPLLAEWISRLPTFTPRRVVVGLMLCALAVLLPLLFFPLPLVPTGLLFGVACTMQMAAQPFVSAIGFSLNTDTATASFGIARGVGSAAYATFSLITGFLVGKSGNWIIILLSVLLLFATAWASAAYAPPRLASSPDGQISSKTSETSTRTFIKQQKQFIFLLVGLMLLFTGYSMGNTYTAQIVSHLGGNVESVGNALSISAFIEVPTMVLFSRISRRFDTGNLLRFSAVFLTAKALFYFAAGNITMIYMGQLVQPLSYALFIPASVEYVDRLLPGEQKVKGHAFVTTATTAGAVLGTLFGGNLIDWFGVPAMLGAGVAVSVAGTLFTFLFSTHLGPKKSLRSKPN